MSATSLPTGTVTLLFTDVEGSTRLVTELGSDSYAEALGEYRAALRAVFTQHGGVEVDTQGDSFFVAFARASDAIAAAAEAATADISTRVGVHTGEPRLAGDDYVGLDVNRAARICAAAHGGQVLLSQATRDLVEGDFRDLGLHRLKDVDEPERLFQVGQGAFPPPRTVSRSNLPLAPSPLIGRNREVSDLVRLVQVEAARLVTLTGPGGVGKTRLALEAAAQLADAFPDGAWFVDLSTLRDAELVLPTMAAALEADNGLADHIADRRMLVVLDNVEQVAAAAPALSELLGSCRGLALVATSREPLRTSAEREYTLRPLPDAPAVELFRRRSNAAGREVDWGYEEVAEICRRVDNLPLAIELAAARARVLAPRELLARLTERLPLLTSGARDAPERHRTLRATIAWSHDLLSSDEQALFCRLAVFAGGWTLDAAESVCAADLDTLASLIEKSLVRRDAERFSMLETIREYALERLAEDPDAEDIRRRHAEYFAAIGEELDHAHASAEGRRRMRELAAEIDNVRAALRWTLAKPEPELALGLAGAGVFPFHAREVATWMDQAMTYIDQLEPAQRAKAYRDASGVRFLFGDFEAARVLGERSVALYQEVGDEAGELRAWRSLGYALQHLGHLEQAEHAYWTSIELGEGLSDSVAVFRGLHGLGELEKDRGEPARAAALLSRAIELARASEDLTTVETALHGLGDAELELDHPDKAAARYREALVLHRDVEPDRLTLYCIGGLAAAAAKAGNVARAAWLWGAVRMLEDELGTPLAGAERARYEAVFAAVAPDVLERGVAPGQDATVDEAIAYALAEDA